MEGLSKENAKIIVIGAGAAGLSAAHHLYMHGFKQVTVLEASGRIGGRINTFKFGHSDDSVVEFGANWIHGTDDRNSVYKLAESNGLLQQYLELKSMEGTCYTEDGRPIKRELIDQAWELFEEISDEMDTFYIGGIKTQNDCLNFINTRLAEIAEKFDEEYKEDVRSVFNCLLNYYSIDSGDSLSMLSLNLWGNYDEIPGGDVKIPGGFTNVLRTLTKDLPQDMILFNKEVTTIKWSNNDIVKPVAINCSRDKDVIMADHVIVTVSLGVLKNASISLFQPGLPKKKLEAIESMGFGVVNKIFLYFDKPFWKVGEGSIKLAWSGDNSNFSPSTWFKHIFAFDEVLNNPHVLSAWTYGRAAEFVEQLSDEEILETCHNLICQFTKNNAILSPSSVNRSAWMKYPYTKGSYSYYHMNSKGNEPEIIQEPLLNKVGRPVVLFAGEATHSEWFSTAHGARSSGIREAQRLESLYQDS